MNKKQNTDWEREIRNAVDSAYDAGKDYYPHSLSGIEDWFVNFIRQTLAKEKLELIERVRMEAKEAEKCGDQYGMIFEKLDLLKGEIEGK